MASTVPATRPAVLFTPSPTWPTAPFTAPVVSLTACDTGLSPVPVWTTLLTAPVTWLVVSVTASVVCWVVSRTPLVTVSPWGPGLGPAPATFFCGSSELPPLPALAPAPSPLPDPPPLPEPPLLPEPLPPLEPPELGG